MSIQLVKPSREYLGSYLDACKEYKEHGVSTFPLNDPDTFLDWKDSIFEKYEDYHLGRNLPNGYVPATTFWLIEDEQWIGMGNIRHRLTPSLEKLGGHIGYCIRYSKWNQGYGTLQLQLLLEEAKKLDLNLVLITCNEANVGSARVMEHNGGILQDIITVDLEEGPRRVKRYWIELPLR